MARARARYRFANEAPGWRYRDLIFDLEPSVERQLQFADFDLVWESFPNAGPLDAMGRNYEEVRAEILRPLMEQPPARRRKLVRQKPFLDPMFAELLLVETEMAEADPKAFAELARTAEWIGDELHPGPEAQEIRARALTFQGVARHRLGDPAGAERFFGAALSALALCPCPFVRASCYEVLAGVREEQNRLADAAFCLCRCVDLYRQTGWSRTSVDWCLSRLGFLYLRLNDPGHAMAALAQIDLEEKAPADRARLHLAMAACLAALDLREPVRLLLQESRAERRFIVRHDHRLPLEWWDARISLRNGDLQDAIPRLDAVRLAHLHCSDWKESCACAVDLVVAYTRARARRTKRRPDVFGDLAGGFMAVAQVYEADFVEQERTALVSALRSAGDFLRQQGLPEAGCCEKALGVVLATPAAAEMPLKGRKRP